MPATMKSLDERMDDFERSFNEFKVETAEFRGRVNVIISILRWTSGLLMATLITIIFHAISISNSAGRVENRVDGLEKRLDKLTEAVDKQREEIVHMRTDMAEIKALLKAKP